MTAAERGAEQIARLPALESARAATGDAGVEQLMRSTRAEMARLALELRAVRHKADMAERSQDALDPATGGFDLPGARELLQSSLTGRIDARRLELARELEATRIEAARVVESAHKRAEAYVAAAHEGVLGTLLRPGEVLRPLPPLPPTAPDELEPRPEPELLVDEPVAAASKADAALDVASILAALQPYLAAPAAAAPAISPSATPPSAFVASEDARPDKPRPPLRSRLLHVDVLLPLIAVCAVLIVLIAWVG